MKQGRENSSAAVPIMDAEAIRRALQRIAHEIIEGNPQLSKVVLAGIPSRGVEIAQRIAAFIHRIENIDIETGIIDVAMHRDDVGTAKICSGCANYRPRKSLSFSRRPMRSKKSVRARSRRFRRCAGRRW